MTETLQYLKSIYINNHSPSLVLFLSGDGTTNDFEAISKNLNERNSTFDYLSFVYRGSEEGTSQSLSTIIEDTNVVTRQFFSKYKEVHLVCTSTGAVPLIFLLCNPEWNPKIRKVVLLDPADYYLPTRNDTQLVGSYLWGGAAGYSPTHETVSDMLLEYEGNAKVHVVGFTLRNTDGTNYYPVEERHLDHDGGYPRMSQEMVKAFYNKIPTQNKGKYVILKNVPHAYVRDGDIEKNYLMLSSLVYRILIG